MYLLDDSEDDEE